MSQVIIEIVRWEVRVWEGFNDAEVVGIDKDGNEYRLQYRNIAGEVIIPEIVRRETN